MKTRAAVLRKAGTPWEITELELDPPKANEVLIQMEAAGLCHSDEHIRSRDMARLPLVGGHEGAGVVVEAGPGVTKVKVGDRVSCSYIPVCGKCRYCSTGKQNLCDAGKHVFAIDPNEWKQQQALQFGATHAFGDPVKAKDVLIDLTRGQLADTVICTVGEMDNDVVKAAVDMTGKAGTIVITGRRVLRDGAARRHPDRVPQEDAGLAVRRRQPAVRHPDDPQPVARGPHQTQRAHYQDLYARRN